MDNINKKNHKKLLITAINKCWMRKYLLMHEVVEGSFRDTFIYKQQAV